VADARIVVERTESRKTDLLRAYRVVLDGEVVGRVKRGESLTVETDAGQHELHLAMDWMRSPSVELDLAPGQEARVRCWPNASPFYSTYSVSGGRIDYIGIELAGG
jgi:hypothetical protein